MSLRHVVFASIALLAAGCQRQAASQQSELQWARAALERNPQLKVISVNEADNTITARVKITGEVLTFAPGELAAIPIADLMKPAASTPVAISAPPDTQSPLATQPSVDAGAPPTAETTPEASEPATAPTYTVERADGRVRVSGPGVSIETAPKTAQATDEGMAQRYDEPIVCDGNRFMHLDNRTLNVDGDAITARGGCELHITNSRIVATGTALTVLDATVHIGNSTLQGADSSFNVSSAARVFMRGTEFKGLVRRSPDAKVQDQGGNSWR